MIAHGPKSLCKEAELYYYDFLCDENHRLIPESIVSHIEQCLHCREQINHLEAALSQADGLESERGRVSSAVTTMLKLHFAYIDKPITCESVKPFLPELSDPALVTRVPTPITVHIDNCQKCSEDLETIRRLNLNRKQLRRLSRLFTDKPAESNVSCTEAQNAIPSLVSIVLSEVDSEVLRHLCICPDCRGLLYQRREMVIRGLPKTGLAEKKFPCEKVSARVFFDYVVPYGLDSAGDQYAKFRQSLTSHLRTCPTCLAKMQELHETIYGICEQAESDVVTIYRIDETAKARIVKQPNAPYAGFPIRVEVRRQEEAEAEAESLSPTVDFAAALRQKASRANLRPLLKSAIAAAAVIFIAAALLLNIPTAKAVTLERIYQAIEKIRNVHITRFVPDKAEPIQEKWVSRTSNIYMTKTGKRCVLWDIANGITKTKYWDAGASEATQSTIKNISDVEQKITGSLGLMPFYDISNIPASAEWNSAADKTLKVTNRGLEVYDLTWSTKAFDGSLVFKKWRLFVDSTVNLPKRIETYHMLPADAGYTLEASMVIEYLSDDEMQKVIKKASF